MAIFIGLGVSLNLYEQYSVDKTKLPLKLETHSRFQRWLSNLKDKLSEVIRGEKNTDWQRSDSEIDYYCHIPPEGYANVFTQTLRRVL